MHDVQPTVPAAANAAERPTPLPLRNDTILGVFEGLGEDFGFNPLWLRVAFSAGLLWNPYVVVGSYLGLGLLVAASRLLFPPRRAAAAAEAPPAPASQAEPANTAEQDEPERELIAA